MISTRDEHMKMLENLANILDKNFLPYSLNKARGKHTDSFLFKNISREERCNYYTCIKTAKYHYLGFGLCKIHRNSKNVLMMKQYFIYQDFGMNFQESLYLQGFHQCDGKGCTNFTNDHVYGNYFCNLHKQEIKKIRVFKKKSVGLEAEISLRMQELDIRKTRDEKHEWYVNYLRYSLYTNQHLLQN